MSIFMNDIDRFEKRKLTCICNKMWGNFAEELPGSDEFKEELKTHENAILSMVADISQEPIAPGDRHLKKKDRED